MDKKIIIDRVIYNSFILFMLFFLIEIITRILMNNTIFDWSLFRIFLSSMFFSVIISLVLSLFSNQVNKLFTYLIICFFSIYSWIQLGLYNYLGFYMGINSVGEGVKVLEFVKDFFNSMDIYDFSIFIPFLILSFYYAFFERKVLKKLI